MTPAPSPRELIETVRADAVSGEPLDELAQAARTARELEESADAVLGHFVERCRRAGYSWTEISGVLGVTRQAAHKRFTGPLPPNAGSEPAAFDRFTPRSRAALRQAAEEARQLGHGFVGTEHLLLALFSDPDGISAKVLARTGVTREAVLGFVTEQVPPTAPLDLGLPMPFTPRATAALRAAVEQALGLGHNYIGTEHLLLGLYGDEGAIAYQALAAAGLGYERAREAVAALVVELGRPKD
ncbi:MAG TPA: Clp protease N-terminal domain-containing protein [Acidimicrobiales bacterium]|nr:Clp protease N-terminal domain-containing protein [Acidimicrobiales bacterium]